MFIPTTNETEPKIIKNKSYLIPLKVLRILTNIINTPAVIKFVPSGKYEAVLGNILGIKYDKPAIIIKTDIAIWP